MVFQKVKSNNSCVNCKWFEINMVPISGTRHETEVEIACVNKFVAWYPNLMPDKSTGATGSPDEMKCSEWEVKQLRRNQ